MYDKSDQPFLNLFIHAAAVVCININPTFTFALVFRTLRILVIKANLNHSVYLSNFQIFDSYGLPSSSLLSSVLLEPTE